MFNKPKIYNLKEGNEKFRGMDIFKYFLNNLYG